MVTVAVVFVTVAVALRTLVFSGMFVRESASLCMVRMARTHLSHDGLRITTTGGALVLMMPTTAQGRVDQQHNDHDLRCGEPHA